ncbi:MAG TPA: aldo/keto reductase [Deinococcales bacterium]|nr:aldo/keto reductase [Deinococcales bacterium]
MSLEKRPLGRTGFVVNPLGLGTWAFGGSWGAVDDQASLAAMHRALDLGVDFFDTADVYGDGRSERLLAQLRRERTEPFVIATKAGRRLDPHTPEGYSLENLRAFVERSLENLNVDALDLLQLHCPPTPVYAQDPTFEALETLKGEGLIRHYGVSVETVAEAMAASARPGVETVQIIFNAFRFKPADDFFPVAGRYETGILARVPLASGLLSGKFTRDSRFAADDHRNFNRHGEAFDVGETFSGVDFETGLQAVEELRPLVPDGFTLAQFALRFVLSFPQVSVVIPGARNAEQVESNLKAAEMPALTPDVLARVRGVYDRLVAPQVHARW